MKRNLSVSTTISKRAKLRLLKFAVMVFCTLLVFNAAKGQTYTSTQTINIAAEGRYKFSVKGGAGTGKFKGDVRDPNAVSANGNWGGTGAAVTADFYLLTGDIVYVIPGAEAQYDSAPVGGGGGGSAVIVNRAGSFHLLIVAGGGGGGGYTEIGLGGSIINYNGIQTAAGGTGDVGGGGGGGGVGAGLIGGAGNNANGGSPGIIANHITANAGSAVNGSNGAAGFGGGGGGGVANRIPTSPGGGGGGGGYIGGNGAAPGASAQGGTSYVNNTEAGFSALSMSAFAGVAGGNSAYSGNAGFVTVTLLPPPPTITSFSPLQAKPGDAVTISGTNFNTTLANNIVFFGATKATVTAANATSLTVTVPAGATNSVISVLNTGTNLSAYSQKAFLPIFAPAKSSIAPTDFAPRVNFTAGTNPGYVTMGDIDGDGKPDMAASNQADNTVSVFLNNGNLGNPSFAAGITLTTGQAPQGVAIGDIDGDGKPDMAVTSYNGNLVSIFRNTSTPGNISFAAKVDIALGSCPFFVVIRDIDGDGRADMVTANKDANTVSIVLNTGEVGNISFAERVDFNTGLKPYSVTVGDLDGDGKPDVAASAYEANSMVVFRNISTVGTVGFGARQDFAVNKAYSISIGDLDGDGKYDLVTGNLSANNISVFRNTSAVGAISFAAKIDIAIGQRVYNVAIGDLDGDGKNDLVTSNYTNNTVSILINTGSSGSISFASQVALTTGAGPSYVSTADMDGDDKPDLLVSNYDDNTVSVLRNNPVILQISGTLSAVNTTYGKASATPASFTVSGSGIASGIIITPPSGFELSQTAGGASGYAGNGRAITVAGTGVIPSKTIYVRLSAAIPVGSYSGNVVAVTGATKINVAIASSTVSAAHLTITATDKTKFAGDANPVFTASYIGFVNGETEANLNVAPVLTTTASVSSPAGTFPISASGAVAANYNMTYVDGLLTILPVANLPVINVAPTLAAIANQTICYTTQTQNISINGITAGPETSQLTTLAVSSTNNSLLSSIIVTPGRNGTAILSYKVNPDATGTATVTVKVKDDGGTANGGSDTFTRMFTITVSPMPILVINSDIGTMINKGETLRLTAVGGSIYSWSGTNGIISGQQSPILTVRPAVTTTYTVTATTAAGCTASQNVTIIVVEDFLKLAINNVMTPDGDGKNDALIIKNIDMYPDNVLRIFDRAGRVILQESNYANNWTGTFNGNPLDEGTYFYILTSSGKERKGFVSIIKR